MNEIRIIIEGINELTEAVRALAGVKGGQAPAGIQAPYGQPPQQAATPAAGQNYGAGAVPMAASVPVQAPNAPVQQLGGSVQAQSVPTQMPNALAQPAAGAAIPTTTVTPGYSLEQLQVAAAGLASAGKMPQVAGILQGFGIQAMTELPKERYGEFAAALREAGAQV